MQNTRTLRQKKILNNWERYNYKASIVCATGFGKTYTAIMGIKGLIKRKQIKKVLVIVPSIGLKSQWEEKLFNEELDELCTVLVINSAANDFENLACDLIIYDEYHRAGSEFFGQVRQIKYMYALAMTATIERVDDAHLKMIKELPICDEVSLDECLENGWVSNYIILNVLVPFTMDDEIEYINATNQFNKAAANCSVNNTNSFETASKWLKSNDYFIKKKAFEFFKTLKYKNNLCKYNYQKIKALKYLLNKVYTSEKGFIFSTSIDFANILQEEISDISVMFHSKLGKKAKAKSMADFLNNNKRLINAVSSLDEGIDVPECSLGIVLDSDSSKRKLRQQLGRVIRATNDPTKKAIFINLCTPNSTEMTWAEKKFKGLKYVNITKSDLDKLI